MKTTTIINKNKNRNWTRMNHNNKERKRIIGMEQNVNGPKKHPSATKIQFTNKNNRDTKGNHPCTKKININIY